MTKKDETEEAVKTSLKIPRRLWREARIRAMDENTDLQTIVSRALEAYLDGGRAKKGGGR